MPIFARVRRTGRCDCSTNRMISSLSAAGYLMRRRPQPRSCSFEQTVLETEVGQFLQRQCLSAQVLDFAGFCLPDCVSGQTLIASLEELLRPSVVQALGRRRANNTPDCLLTLLHPPCGKVRQSSRGHSDRWRDHAPSSPRRPDSTIGYSTRTNAVCTSRTGYPSRPARQSPSLSRVSLARSFGSSSPSTPSGVKMSRKSCAPKSGSLFQIIRRRTAKGPVLAGWRRIFFRSRAWSVLRSFSISAAQYQYQSDAGACFDPTTSGRPRIFRA